MTIEETIECCEEMAEDLEERSKIARMADHKYAIYCKERAENNRQFAEWLKDYKKLLSAVDDIKAEIETEKESMIQHNGISDLGLALEIINEHIEKEKRCQR